MADFADHAQHQEEMARERSLAFARQQSAKTLARDIHGELCTGCSYATRTNFGKQCEAWAECLADLQKRERVGQ